MNSIDALDYAIVRVRATRDAIEGRPTPTRKHQERNAALIARYADVIETLSALRQHIADGQVVA